MPNSDKLEAVLEKVNAIENRISQIEKSGTPAQSEQVREAVLNVPEIFEIELDGETIELKLFHPTYYKLELIANEIDQMKGALEGKKLMDEESILRFVFYLCADPDISQHAYRILQIAFDPKPDPDLDELAIDLRLIKLLNPAQVVDSLIKRSIPFFSTMAQIANLGR